MHFKITIKDNSPQIQQQLAKNVNAALTAIGTEAVGMIVDQMEKGYGRPIRQTGDLMRDVSYKVEQSGKGTVDVGNSLFYGPYVHDGTSKMAGRPYIRDALTNGTNINQLALVATEQLKKRIGQ